MKTFKLYITYTSGYKSKNDVSYAKVEHGHLTFRPEYRAHAIEAYSPISIPLENIIKFEMKGDETC